MDLSTYFQPITRESIDFQEAEFGASLGSETHTFWEGEAFPDIKNCTLALVGVCEERGSLDNAGCASAPDAVRRKLYHLSSPAQGLALADLGNIAPGRTHHDTLFALTEVAEELLRQGITPIVLGGGQELSLALYKAYAQLGRVMNIVAIDPRFDLDGNQELNSHSWLYHVVRQDPNFLFNFSNLGHQSYFCDRNLVELMDDLHFDAYRLGLVQSNMRRAETVIRAADMVSIDLGAVRQSDCPAQANPSPHGFYGEELCQMARFAGLSDKVSSIGFFELNPRYDNRLQSAHMVAHALWYFLEGFAARVSDFPYRDKENYRRYLVTLNPQEISLMPSLSGRSHESEFMHADLNNSEIVFIKSKKSERWWMEVPCKMDERRERYLHHLLIPCTYEEYQQAMQGNIPDLWWKFYYRVNEL